MFKSFEELLEKTKGYPEQQKADLRNMADTLDAIGVLAQADLQKEVAEIIENLPEIRKQRAQAMRESAQGLPKDEKALRLKDADRLAASAEKLKLPTADEQFKNRAMLTELSIRLKQKIRGFDKTLPELDPDRLERYHKAIHAAERAMPADLSAEDRNMSARFAFATELMGAGGPENFDLAVDNFYKAVCPVEFERGHKGDVEFTTASENALNPEQHTQDYLTQCLQEQDNAERLEWVQHNKLISDMSTLAAQHLKPMQYAAYRIMIDNSHLLDWKLENNQLTIKAKTISKKDPENTIGKILQRELGYKNIQGANQVIHKTLQEINKTLAQSRKLLERYGKDSRSLIPGPKAAERMQQTTREVIDNARAQRKGPEL